jgi:hypothetical protein
MRDPTLDEVPSWPDGSNYFNYFTEVEEHFQRARGTGLFLMSPLDWALVESWKNASVPLEAVLRGIDLAFSKWRARKNRTQAVNSIAYCAQAVATEAAAMANAGARSTGARRTEPPFTLDEMRVYVQENAKAYRIAGQTDISEGLEAIADNAETHFADIESLEQRLTGLEDKVLARLRSELTEDELFEARQELDRQLRPYRAKMTAPQLMMLEKQYLDRRLLEHTSLPRLSLFYMR